ncbi:hypothetical protein MVEN_00135100 [Mycena venus]|uniref:Uncharacterized protein n=1 Tax=Mycena venus TaxID=2733690 RepID=A0A8H6Z0K1_9AGAR|nr:hypothetical protein MVEN_00135100 [Mycena venus]
MARFVSLLCAVVAAATAASAAAIQAQERDSILAAFFIDIDFGGQELTVGGDLPTGCLTPPPVFDGSVSSVQISTGVKCTLWSGTECTGGSITLAADTPDLRALGFNDLMLSVECLPN